MITEKLNKHIIFAALSASFFVFAAGFLVIISWVFDLPVLRKGDLGFISMAPSTALCFILCAISLFVQLKNKYNKVKFISWACSILVIFIGLFTFLGIILKIDFNIDKLLFSSHIFDNSSDQSAMVLITALNFLFVGSALFFREWKQNDNIFLLLIVIPFVDSMIALAGYVFDVRYLYSLGNYYSMSIYTAISFISLSLGILFLYNGTFFARIFTSNTTGGILLRRLLPAAVFLPVIIRVFGNAGISFGIFNAVFGETLEVIANIFLFSFLIIWNADTIFRKDTKLLDAQKLNRHLASIVESSTDAIMSRDINGFITSWNKGAENLYGYKAEEIIGKSILETIPSERLKEFDTLSRIINGGENIDLLETYRVRKDGTRITVSINVSPIKGINENVIGASIIARDITERIEAEEALKASEKQYKQLFESANDAILVIDPHTEEIIDVNSKACEMYGSYKEELIGMDLKKITVDMEKGEKKIAELREKGTIKDVETRHYRKDRSIIDILYNSSIINYKGKNAILSIYRDITVRKEHEKIIRQTSEQLRLLYETSENLNKTLDLEQIYEIIHTFVSGIMDCDGLCLSSYNPKEKIATCLAGWNGNKRIDVSGFPKLELEDEGHGTQSRVIRSGKSLLINDYGQYEHTSKKVYYIDNTGNISEDSPKGNIVAKSALLLPLKIDNEVIGVLQVFSYQKDAYSESNLQLLESIALHVGSSVNNARLYEKAQIEIAERKKAELELFINEKRYRNLFESANDAILVLEPGDEIILDANQSACELYGFAKKDFLGMSMVSLSVNPELGEQKINELFEKGNVKNSNTVQRKADGTLMDIIYNASLIDYNGKKAILTVNRDDTMRKRTEEDMLKLSVAVEQSPESIIITGTGGNIEYVNKGFTDLTGYTFDEVKGKNPRFLQSGVTPAVVYEKMWNNILSGKIWLGEVLNKKKNGDLFWQSVSITPIKNPQLRVTHFLSIQEDITEKKENEEKLRNSLKEKETMLKEIHHRVKNNLQIISSLLKLQSESIKDKDALLIFKDSQRRLRAMALIHQNLYASETLSSIDFSDYVRKLVADIFSSFDISAGQIKSELIIDEVFLDIETSIPCGLIINELVSNSLKYAFNGTGNSLIRIGFAKISESGYLLSVSDNGVGMPAGFDFKSTNTLGLKLVDTLTQQLEGTLILDNSGGTKFTIEFCPPSYKKRL
jgi:PAS domain S-box-containing protein